MTERDSEMLSWLGTVRVADLDAVQWALGAMNGSGIPVSSSFARRWVRRMFVSGFIGRARPTFQDSSLIWVAPAAGATHVPNPLRATTRHQAAVARISARMMCLGYEWSNDRRAARPNEHQADGVAASADAVLLVEVELTPKTDARYQKIFANHRWRVTREGVRCVLYFCDGASARKVTKFRDKTMTADLAPYVQVSPILGARGEMVDGWESVLETLRPSRAWATGGGRG